MCNRDSVKAHLLIALGVVTFIAMQAPAPAHASSPSGAYLFKTYCATCHGKDAKGNGPFATELRFAPPDLTLFAKRGGGVYPREQMFLIIDGRQALKGHGGPEMPVWGDAFKGSAEGYDEQKVKEKIDALVDFLKSIQVGAK